jgi:hypothetical protein
MKQVKIAFAKCKKKLPKRPPNEIDFGLGFRAALRWILSEYSVDIDEAYKQFPHIKEELQ